jgi:hypothetical protein
LNQAKKDVGAPAGWPIRNAKFRDSNHGEHH